MILLFKGLTHGHSEASSFPKGGLSLFLSLMGLVDRLLSPPWKRVNVVYSLVIVFISKAMTSFFTTTYGTSRKLIMVSGEKQHFKFHKTYIQKKLEMR